MARPATNLERGRTIEHKFGDVVFCLNDIKTRELKADMVEVLRLLATEGAVCELTGVPAATLLAVIERKTNAILHREPLQLMTLHNERGESR
jgi:hypothetical protein